MDRTELMLAAVVTIAIARPCARTEDRRQMKGHCCTGTKAWCEACSDGVRMTIVLCK